MKQGSRILLIDCRLAGIAGDMFLAGLIDLGADASRVIKAVEGLCNYVKGCKEIRVSVGDVMKLGFRAKRLKVESDDRCASRPAKEIRKAVKDSCRDLRLSAKAQRFASDAVDTLIEAEARLHGEKPGRTHLHEAGSIDTLVDIVGGAVALESLSLFDDVSFYCTPVAVGGGLHSFSHGTTTVPPPASLEILKAKGLKIKGGPVHGELTTPTGASILAALVDQCVEFYPPMTPKAVGYGAGSMKLESVPNILRVVLGETSAPFVTDRVIVLETNVDDASGEVLGYTTQRLVDEGALDVAIIPTLTKKNRPGHIVKVISDEARAERLSALLMEETGTLGVRVYPTTRHVAARRVSERRVRLPHGEESVRLKVAVHRDGRILRVKPEYDDVVKLAHMLKRPLRDVLEEVSRLAKEESKQEG